MRLMQLFATLSLAFVSYGFACPKGFVPHGEECYTLSEAQGSMSRCQDSICAELGGTLAVAKHESVKSFLLGLVSSRNVSAFIGLYEKGLDESGDWVWLDGSTLYAPQNETNYTLPFGWSFGEPNNWCKDEDCAALGMKSLPRYASFGSSVNSFLPLRDVGWFDIACSTSLHCLCQSGHNVSEDFLMWEFNNSEFMTNVSEAENSLNFSSAYDANYGVCWTRRTKCAWYQNGELQKSFVGAAVVSFLLLAYSMMGCSGMTTKPPTSDLVNDLDTTSSYGQLLEACDRQDDVDSLVDRWVVRGSWAAMTHGVALFALAVTALFHVNYGVRFGFVLDGLESLVMSIAKLSVSLSACMVQRHLSNVSRSVVEWWILVFALSKIAMCLLDLVLSAMYFNNSIGGFVKQNGTFCASGYLFLWMLMLSMVFQSIAGVALCRIFTRAVSHVGGIASMLQIVGCSGFLLIVCTFGSGFGQGVCSALFVFDVENDNINPVYGIAFSYAAAAICYFLAGGATLLANFQIKNHYSKGARTLATSGQVEMIARF